MMSWTEAEGAGLPLGARWCEQAQAWNFALYPNHGEQVTLLLYATDDFVKPRLRYTWTICATSLGASGPRIASAKV